MIGPKERGNFNKGTLKANILFILQCKHSEKVFNTPPPPFAVNVTQNSVI